MDNETRKRAADRDADEALDAILREIDSADTKRPAASDEMPAPRRSAASRSDQERRRRAESSEHARARAQQSRSAAQARESAGSEERAARPAAQRPAAQRHRLPAAAERPEERSQRLAAERARNAANTEDRPVRRQPAERPQRPVERQQRPAQRPQQRSTQAPARPAAQRSGSRAAAKRRPNMFRIGMALYIFAFIVLLLFGMHKLNVFLFEYESSLPEHTIDGYVAGLNGSFYTEMIRQHVDEIEPTAYETPDTIAETLDIGDYDGSGFTWAKNVKEFSNDKPAYFIRTGNAAIAKVTLKQIGETPEFGKPIWQVEPATSLIEVAAEPQYSAEITVPDGASVMVNGTAVPFEDMLKADAAVKLDDAAQMYAQQPTALHISIPSLYVAPKVQAFDSLGNALTATKQPAATDAEQVFVFEPKAEASPDQDFVDRAKDMMRAYIDYMANKDEALWTNLGVLDNYLVANSSAYKKLHGIAGDINWNNPYTARLDRELNVTNVRMYSENVCTCDVHYDYQLTKNVVNDYVGDMRWTFVKTGNVWNASEFEITGSNDTKFESDEDNAAAPAEPAEPEQEG